MAAKKFRFVSPGIFLNEVDQSQLPAIAEAVGPVIIGRAEKGPGMIPVRVNSFSEFVETFGNPIDGKGGTDDQWRDVNRASPTYGAYAAQAYLKANVGPVNFVRLMGTQHADASSTGQAGWKTTNTPDVTLASNGGAYGLFVWPSASCPQVTLTVNSVKSIKLLLVLVSCSRLRMEHLMSATAFAGTHSRELDLHIILALVLQHFICLLPRAASQRPRSLLRRLFLHL
jgi:heme exporter protein D